MTPNIEHGSTVVPTSTDELPSGGFRLLRPLSLRKLQIVSVSLDCSNRFLSVKFGSDSLSLLKFRASSPPSRAVLAAYSRRPVEKLLFFTSILTTLIFAAPTFCCTYGRSLGAFGGMKVVSMVVGQASIFTCPRVVSRSCCSGNFQQPVLLLWGAPLLRMDSTLSLARSSCSIGLTSSFCMPQGSPYIKSGKKNSAALGKLWRRQIHKERIRCQLGGASSSQEDEIRPDANMPSTLGGNDTVQFDLNLPRRSLLVEFTCNVCQARTQRLINPDALRRGTVYVQCGGCEAYHQLVDNLNLVEEYNFKDEVDSLGNDLGV